MMSAVRSQGLCGLVVWFVAGAAYAQDYEAARAELYKASWQLQSLDPFDIWQNIPGQSIRGDDEHVDDRFVLDRMSASDYSSASLIRLTDDTSPRIRTLAMALLFKKEDPQLLPYIAKRLTDETPTFSVFVQLSAIIGPPPEVCTQTVRDFAGAMVRMYVARSGPYPSFSDYWEARKGRSYCLSWLRVKYFGAARLSTPLDANARTRVAAFRENLAKRPPVDRDLYLIWLQSSLTEPDLATDADLTAAVKRLGRQNVLGVAEGTPPSSDPDLQPATDPLQYERAVALILDHSAGVLLPTDLARLRALGAADFSGREN